MDLSEVIRPEKIFRIQQPYENKMSLLKDLLAKSIENTPVEDHFEGLWQALYEREVSMSTGIGMGIAIPHCSTELVSDVYAALAILDQKLEFEAVDDQPVQIVVLLLMPRERFERHIKTLAGIAKMFNDESFRDRVLKETSAESVHEMIRMHSQAAK